MAQIMRILRVALRTTNSNISVFNFNSRLLLIKSLIFFSISVLAIDFAYKSINNISYQNREACILYNLLPKVGFLFYEYFIELLLIVIVGIFVAVLLEKRFKKFKKFYPKNQITAFVYASVIPVCSCSAIPLLQTMQNKMPLRTIITFVVAAPLLNPYIIMLSFSVLGVEYGILRIVGSACLALLTGLVAEYFMHCELLDVKAVTNCKPKSCKFIKPNIYEDTFEILKKVLPYILIAGFLGLLFEFYDPARFLQKFYFGNNWLGIPFAVLVGTPIYFCNGADVVFLKPVIEYAGLSLGTAMTFSLTSTSICISSFIMLLKFIGKRLTLIITVTVVVLTMLMGFLINLYCSL
jgi:uncharacterized protein